MKDSLEKNVRQVDRMRAKARVVTTNLVNSNIDGLFTVMLWTKKNTKQTHNTHIRNKSNIEITMRFLRFRA